MQQIIIDVREPDEYASGHVTGSINLPLGLLMRGADELADIPKNTKLVVYCRSGGRAEVATNALTKQGFTNVTNGINQKTVEARLGQ